MPQLKFDEHIYYNDFNALCTERLSGAGNIPITRINQYAVQHGIHDITLFENIIMRIDDNYVGFLTKIKSNKKKADK